MASREQLLRTLGVRWWQRVAWGELQTFAVLAMLLWILHAEGSRGYRWTFAAMVCCSALVMLWQLVLVIARFWYAPAEDLRWAGADHRERVLGARAVLPADPPAGWSKPILRRASATWTVETGSETVAVTLVKRGEIVHARVIIAPLADAAAVADARCAEILRPMRDVTEFAESEPYPQWPQARVWLAVLRDTPLPIPVPKAPPKAREPELSPHLVAARQYLPQKLPVGWSVPMAVTSTHGTEWSDGAWAIGVEDQLVLAALVTSKGRVKLMVAIIRGDGERASESAALDVLRHFRGVLEFVETTGGDDVPGGMLYLGELPMSGTKPASVN
jgi:hypothetical protein